MSEDTLQPDYRKALEESGRANFNPWNPLPRKRRFNLLVNQHTLRLNLARLRGAIPEGCPAPIPRTTGATDAVIVPLEIRFPRVEGGPSHYPVTPQGNYLKDLYPRVWGGPQVKFCGVGKTFPPRVIARVVDIRKPGPSGKSYSLKTWFPRVWGGPLYGSVPQLRLEVTP
jgi:hypothetical protein